MFTYNQIFVSKQTDVSIDAKADMEQKKLLNKVVIFVCFLRKKSIPIVS